jgi:hypothetical protein
MSRIRRSTILMSRIRRSACTLLAPVSGDLSGIGGGGPGAPVPASGSDGRRSGSTVECGDDYVVVAAQALAAEHLDDSA